MKIRTVLIDDEFLAIRRLETLIQVHKDIDVVGTATNKKDAIKLIQNKNPDLIFLDIQMPDGSGFDVLSSIQLENHTHVIFATAFDKFAIEAFDSAAVDYLLKPFDEDRFLVALEKVRTLIRLKNKSQISDKIQSLLSGLQEDYYHESGFNIKKNGIDRFIHYNEILYIEASGNYIRIYTESDTYSYRSTLSSIDKKLSNSSFLRIHRSYLINTIYLKKYTYTGNNEYKFTLLESTELVSSRSYRNSIIHFLKENGYV